ncbi:MAG TPA: hypothetical protein VFA44_08495 [Gaiellaceae bacterium]|nr:hypothetical protein [Gaiellaceae bacterium]
MLADHRRLLRGAFAQHNVIEIDTQGDAFFVVFTSARDAFSAAFSVSGAASVRW